MLCHQRPAPPAHGSFASVGLPPLDQRERQSLFGVEGRAPSWGRFLDRLLLT